jgi:predicted metal-binding transcription factor (methanogenesis marker protein 9)
VQQFQCIAHCRDPLEFQVLLYRSCMMWGDLVWCCIQDKVCKLQDHASGVVPSFPLVVSF